MNKTDVYLQVKDSFERALLTRIPIEIGTELGIFILKKNPGYIRT